VPRTVDNSDRGVGEEVEQTGGHVEAAPWASRTLVGDLSLRSLAVGGNGNHLEAVIILLILSLVQGHDELIRCVHNTTSAKASIKEGETSAVELVTLSDSARGTLSQSMMLSTVQMAMTCESRGN
jgi:hypothetical protein